MNKEFIGAVEFRSFCSDLKEAVVKVGEVHFPANSKNADMIYASTISALGALASDLIRINPDPERRRNATEIFIETFYEAVTLPRKRQ